MEGPAHLHTLICKSACIAIYPCGIMKKSVNDMVARNAATSNDGSEEGTMAVGRRNPKVKREAPEASEPTKKQVKEARKEKLSKTAKIVLVAIGILAMLLSVTAMACSGVLNEVNKEEPYELTGGVAATVNGVNIKEDTVTNQIMSLRTGSYDKDADWAAYLASQGLTPESYRENVIDGIARQYLLVEAEKECGITVSQEDLDKAWKDAVKNYGGDEKAFVEMIEQVGFTKDTYLENIKSSLAQQKLKDEVAPAEKPSDEEIITYLNENLSTYSGARRSSHILFKVAEDATDEQRAKVEAEAQKVLDQINAGEIEFAKAAKKYSEDSSADKGGDVGWDKLTTFVPEYQDALSKLGVDQVSGLVKTTYGYHIIKCTELFEVQAVTSLDEVPEGIRTYVSDMLESQAVATAYGEWLTDYTEKAEIKINPMPENVPYNVDMKKASEKKDDSAK